MSFAKDGYIPGELVQMIIEIDNSHCSANISTINISVSKTVTMRSQGHSTSDSGTVFNKLINGLYAGESLVVRFLLFREKKQFVNLSSCLITLALSQHALESSFQLSIIWELVLITISPASAALIESVQAFLWYILWHLDHFPNDSYLPDALAVQ
jgi:hypothetical protein